MIQGASFCLKYGKQNYTLEKNARKKTRIFLMLCAKCAPKRFFSKKGKALISPKMA